jgi:pimeloyl-ACP methyl ester carboxylesterase
MEMRSIDGIAFKAGAWPLVPERPTVVFVHGSGGSHVLWGPQVQMLAGDMNTVALDLPGHGASAGPACDRVADYAAIVARFIARLGARRNVACGLSLGGAIVLQMLLDYPDKLAGAVLAGTGARLRVLPAIFEAIAADYPGFVALQGQIGASPATDPRKLAPIQGATADCPPAVTAGDFRACDRFDVMARLGEIDRPVLVICGADDKLTPPKYSDYLVQQIRGARGVRIPRAGHLAPLEQPADVVNAIRAFVAEAIPASGP